MIKNDDIQFITAEEKTTEDRISNKEVSNDENEKSVVIKSNQNKVEE